MTDRIVVEQYNWETQVNDQVTVDGNAVQKFINHLMTKTRWKNDPEELLEMVLRLRKKLAQDIRPPDPFLARNNTKRDPVTGRLVSKGK